VSYDYDIIVRVCRCNVTTTTTTTHRTIKLCSEGKQTLLATVSFSSTGQKSRPNVTEMSLLDGTMGHIPTK